MSAMDPNALKASVDAAAWHVSVSRPRLLFGPEAAPAVRQRAAARPGLIERVTQNCRNLLATPPEAVNTLLVSRSSSEMERMAEGHLLLGDPAYAEWAKRRGRALLQLDSWMAPVHRAGCRHCDHVVTNVAADIALAHDLLGDAFSTAETEELAAGLRRLHFLPFLQALRGRVEWWAKETCESNWKIMSCGESGFAICGFAEHWPEAREALAFAAQAVTEILNRVPPEGDWPEGINYWFATLRMGLRFATALRRLTRGAVDLYAHDALKATGNYPTMLTTPGRRVYHFNDNSDSLGGPSCEGLIMLAREQQRGDWLGVARMFPVDSVTFLALDDPAVPSETPPSASALFPRTGVATLRTGWKPSDTFVGFKCGPSNVGHSHLDAASFVIEASGQPLVWDTGTWPYAHFIGFFDTSRLRWNWDSNGTAGHTTLLVDGQGQTWGRDYPGQITALDHGPGWDLVIGDASRTYPGLLRTFLRTLLFIHPDTLIVRDVVRCDGDRHVEWLLHYAGTISTEGPTSVIRNGDRILTVTPFLPDRSFGWRVSDVVRTSTYEDSNTRQMETRFVRYRSFQPFRAAQEFEFLFGLRVQGRENGSDWEFERGDAGWILQAAGHPGLVRPEASGLRWP